MKRAPVVLMAATVVVCLVLSWSFLAFASDSSAVSSSPASSVATSSAVASSAAASSAAASSEHRTVRVGIAETQSDVEIGGGATAAFEKDYLQAVAEYADWDLEYVDASWSDCLEMLKDGDIDVLTDVSMTDERLAYYDYSSSPMGTEMCYLYARGDTDLRYDDFSSFDGMTVGYEKGSTIIDSFSVYGQEMGFTVDAVPFDDGSAMFAALAAGEVDAAIETNLYDAPADTVIIAKCAPSFVYIATTKKDPTLVVELDKAMAALLSYSPDFNYQIYEYHLGNAESQPEGYTQEELAYLAEHPVVDVYYETDWKPFEFNVDGEAEGITPDVIRAIGDDTGITFRFVLSSSTQAIYSDSASKSKDTVMAVSYDYTWANAHDLLVTQPYIMGTVMRVTRKSGVEPTTVAIVEGGYLGNQVQKRYPELQPVEYQTFAECMEAVSTGKADCTFLNFYQASNYRSMSAYEDFDFQPDSLITQSISLGVTRESDPALFSILSKSLKYLAPSVIPGILNKDSIQSEPLTLQVLLRRYPVQFAVTGGVFCGLIALLVVMLVTSSARKRKNLQLAAATEEAKAANAAKSDFLSRMSHDMRTPLNGIIGMTYLTQEMNLPEKAHDNLDKIETSSKFLLSLINDVLDMSKAENGVVELHLEPYPMDRFLSYMDAVIRPLCAEKDQNFVIDADPAEGVVPLMDVLLMNRIFFNLISNAVKYTPEKGTVTLRYRGQLLGGHQLGTRIEVSDTGIGMSEEFQKVLFEPFTQEHRVDNEEMRGSGLGLAIVKRLVDAMGGTIRVKSVPGEGTTFVLDLVFDFITADKVSSDKPVQTSPASEVGLSGRHILLCEDHPLNQEIATAILTQKGALVKVAEDGQVGVTMFEQSTIGYYDCILMDLRMPVMDGYAATRAIRALDRPDARTVPIIAMTADAFADDVQRCRDAGMDAHVAKPIDPDALFTTIGEHLQARSS